MRLAIISDIHSNLEALTGALEFIDRERVDSIVCLGDIVGYGANPNECVALVRSRCAITLQGNHDAAVVRVAEAERFTAGARTAALWTNTQIEPDHLEYLAGLPYTWVLEDLLFVHASPCSPDQWDYILSDFDASLAFGCFTEQVCFHGHSHIPAIFAEKEDGESFSRDTRWLVNVGSVGQPRDGNSELSFGIFDTDVWSYRNIRSPYDIQTAADKIRRAGLPARLADRLFVGT
jgi:predicted phosphodiesterase